MRKLLIAGVVALCLSGCRSATSPGDLVVTAELSEEPLQSGAEVQIMITVTNTGEASVEIADPCEDMGYRILNSDGELIVSSFEFDCAMEADAVAPGEDLVVTHRWAAIEGYGKVGGSGAPLPPGTYTLVPVVIVDGRSIEGEVISFVIT